MLGPSLVRAWAVRAACLAACCLFLSGCAGSGNEDVPAAAIGGSLVVHLPADIDSWTPYTARNTTSASIVDLLFPRLVRERSTPGDAGFDPWLAESWAFSEDRRRLTFDLRQNARWSDGSSIVCEDVQFSLQVQRSEEVGWTGRGYKERILDVECPDEHTAVFVFETSYPDQMLDANDNALVPRAFADVPPGDWRSTAWEDRLITAGPFRIQTIEVGERIVLERDPFWWGEPARLDRVVLRIHPDRDAAFLAFRSGEIDVFPGAPETGMANGAGTEFQKIGLASRSYLFIAWNQLAPTAYVDDRKRRGCSTDGCEEGPGDIVRLARDRPHTILTDRRVRRALSLGIDRRDMLDGLWNGRGEIATGPILPDSWAYRTGYEPRFDPAEADRLLNEAGWTDRDEDGIRMRDGERLQLDVVVYAENPRMVDALERATAHLRGLGVALVAVPLPRGEFVRRAWDKQFDGVLSAWRVGTRVEPDILFHTRNAVDRGNNLIGWTNPDWDALFDAVANAGSREEALPYWAEWQESFARERPYTLLVRPGSTFAAQRHVHDAAPTELQTFHDLHRWWVEERARP